MTGNHFIVFLILSLQYDILIVFKLLAVWLYPFKGPFIAVMNFTFFLNTLC